MGMIIQITEEKIDELAEGMEEMLHVGGRMMSCIENLRRGSEPEMGFRKNDRYRGDRYDKEKWEDNPSWRRGSDGRYM